MITIERSLKVFDETKFYLGKLCKHNHEYEDSNKSLRKINNRYCVECRKGHIKSLKEKSPEYQKEYRIKNKDKLSNKSKEYYKKNKDIIDMKRIKSKN